VAVCTTAAASRRVAGGRSAFFRPRLMLSLVSLAAMESAALLSTEFTRTGRSKPWFKRRLAALYMTSIESIFFDSSQRSPHCAIVSRSRTHVHVLARPLTAISRRSTCCFALAGLLSAAEDILGLSVSTSVIPQYAYVLSFAPGRFDPRGSKK
jgi:hypothetical protein